MIACLVYLSHVACAYYRITRKITHSEPTPTNIRAFHGAVSYYCAVKFGTVLLNRTAPYDFTFTKTAPQRRILKKKFRTERYR